MGDDRPALTVRDAWLRRRRSPAECGTRLVCLPHAGGTASFYLNWAADLDADSDVLAVQYPGREDRLAEQGPDDIPELARLIADAVAGIAQVPLVLFGHSLGALVAYEVARELEQRHHVRVAHLVVSGRAAPSEPVTGDVHLRDDAGLVSELDRLGGVGTEVLRSPAAREVFLPAIRADFRLAETHRPTAGASLQCPVTAVFGTEDTEVDLRQARKWAAHTTGPFAVHSFPGGHFYLLEHRKAVQGLIAMPQGVAG
ncbi:thioesterase II family protein [Amycolatopsis jejuensis]|uniref:thioesterase II family protein n=1 Tax=Amycolatopsis jejuensis TaxID=330084 RepID=UPI000524DD12|nr:alpha/beta fold hydrolase [Amycolatopsis jejuensis]